MNNNNMNKWKVVENFPLWAVEPVFMDNWENLSDRDEELVKTWLDRNNMGNPVDFFEEYGNDADPEPAFGFERFIPTCPAVFDSGNAGVTWKEYAGGDYSKIGLSNEEKYGWKDNELIY